MNSVPFLAAYQGRLTNMLRWEQLDDLWEAVRSRAGRGWYLYAVGETPPAAAADAQDVMRFITHVDALLRREHDEDYCGIVYTDAPGEPSLVKIYDPGNLGAVCGSTGAPPPLPGWVMSLLPPVDLQAAFPPPANRRRWWQRLFGG